MLDTLPTEVTPGTRTRGRGLVSQYAYS